MKLRKYERVRIDGEEVMLLRHMILAHHGKMEFGSPKLPHLKEAEILFLSTILMQNEYV